MARDIPTTISSVVAAVENRPIELYEVELDTGMLYYAQAEAPVVFGGQTYQPIAVTRTPVRTSAELAVDEVEIRFDNINLALSQQIIATDFIGRPLAVKKVFRENLSSASLYIPIFDGRMDEPLITQQQLSVRVRSSLDALHQYVPRRVYSTMCNYQIYDGFCMAAKTAGTNVVTGTAIGSSTATVAVAAVLSGHADDYWGPIGTLVFNAGSNRNVGREIIHSSQGSNSVSVRVAFPYTINSGEMFTLYRGCRKTLTDCMSKFNNFVNYGGFHTIPKTPLV